MHVLILRPYRKDNIYFRTIEEREKIISHDRVVVNLVSVLVLVQLSGAVSTLLTYSGVHDLTRSIRTRIDQFRRRKYIE